MEKSEGFEQPARYSGHLLTDPCVVLISWPIYGKVVFFLFVFR